MQNGKIIKLVGGVYTVFGDDGIRYERKPLGLFRYRKIYPKVGDDVLFDAESITQLLPRRNEMVRPAVANVDHILIVSSCKEPTFSFQLLDRFLALVIHAGIDPVILVTKTDLMTEAEMEVLSGKLAYYQKYFPVFYTSAKALPGIPELREWFKGKIVVLSGQTGAGKSSILNTIDPSLRLETNEISKALGRGKHTTRHVELLRIGDGWVADTPGFSKLDFVGFDARTLHECYPDFLEHRDECRFHGCIHINEPGCRIKELVRSGAILPERYDHYQRLVEEIKATKPIF
ncbi:MAG TPA: ribosome small subunit-dependent GTPase A [Candidatus Izemoplasmatales bacterium]|nr:ribosome small subunit-dependent GTPase A [Candidatus Izemoplasmatales bacterium]